MLMCGLPDEPRYEQRDRSASPRPSKRDDDYPAKREDSYRNRSASPNGRVDSRYVIWYHPYDFDQSADSSHQWSTSRSWQ